MEEIVNTFNSNSNSKKTNTNNVNINKNKNTKKEVLEVTPTIVCSKNSKNTVTYRINSNTDLSSISNINIKSINNKNKSNTILNNIDSSNPISHFTSDSEKKQPFISKSKLIATASTAWNSNQKLYCASNKKLSTKIYFSDINSKQQSSGYVNNKKLSFNKDQVENEDHSKYNIIA